MQSVGVVNDHRCEQSRNDLLAAISYLWSRATKGAPATDAPLIDVSEAT
jgi:hypothetical protein